MTFHFSSSYHTTSNRNPQHLALSRAFIASDSSALANQKLCQSIRFSLLDILAIDSQTDRPTDCLQLFHRATRLTQPLRHNEASTTNKLSRIHLIETLGSSLDIPETATFDNSLVNRLLLLTRGLHGLLHHRKPDRYIDLSIRS